MKKSVLFVLCLMVCVFGYGQSQRGYVIMFNTPNGTVCFDTQSVVNIHIDASGQTLIHSEGTELTPLADMDTVSVVRAIDTADWVDLGLPSGLLWATRNVGANHLGDNGDYFAWAETQPKSVYDWSTYTYSCNGDNHSFTKYCRHPNYGCDGLTDTLTILQHVDDAATASLGDGARMPTLEEWQELNNNCTSVWTTQYGVNGRLFIGSNGNTLFLPAAGWWSGNDLVFVGTDGEYWSSSLYVFYSDMAWYFDFNSAGSNTSHFNSRDWGRPIRAVKAN